MAENEQFICPSGHGLIKNPFVNLPCINSGECLVEGCKRFRDGLALARMSDATHFTITRRKKLQPLKLIAVPPDSPSKE